MNLTLTEQQQQEMRHAHYDGAPGVLVSGLIWIVAALICYQLGIKQGVWTLLVGGALIYPISVIFSKALGRQRRQINPTHSTNWRWRQHFG